MNNIELRVLKSNLKKYLEYTDEKLDDLHTFNEEKLVRLKRIIGKMQSAEYEKNRPNIRRKIDVIFGNVTEPTESTEPMKRKL